MDNPCLVNAAENGPKSVLGEENEALPAKRSGQTTGWEAFFLAALGVVFAKEATTPMGDILAFLETASLASAALLLSAVTETARGGFDGFFLVTSS